MNPLKTGGAEINGLREEAPVRSSDDTCRAGHGAVIRDEQPQTQGHSAEQPCGRHRPAASAAHTTSIGLPSAPPQGYSDPYGQLVIDQRCDFLRHRAKTRSFHRHSPPALTSSGPGQPRVGSPRRPSGAQRGPRRRSRDPRACYRTSVMSFFSASAWVPNTACTLLPTSMTPAAPSAFSRA